MHRCHWCFLERTTDGTFYWFKCNLGGEITYIRATRFWGKA